eukprot:TRINITY_DN2532_c0_g1_i11.p1 TRINITY_DN2532_c0_g1~~TRINITY_DN2532_c0_g1_i11.p1  ORF type:complete len:273 (-),score=26.41 TRINITY_DN2532_c0_g1_i11:959-1777(-)
MSRDEFELGKVKWTDVETSTYPPSATPAKHGHDCVFFPSCDRAHDLGNHCVGDPECLWAKMKTKALRVRFELPTSSEELWVCPPCCWEVDNGADLVVTDEGADHAEGEDEEREEMTDTGGVAEVDLLTEAESHADPTVRRLVQLMVARNDAMALKHEALEAELAALRKEKKTRVPFDLDLRRVVEWVPYLDCPSGVDAILSAIALRYGPFVDKPESDANAGCHESMRIWHYLRVARDEEGKWSKDLLPTLHSYMLRLVSAGGGREDTWSASL